ncbi:MAG: putative permease, partial [Rhizorhabdus sp.]|nr:putative permease [Rhizorhabdus sp.]
SSIYAQEQSGQIDFGRYFVQMQDRLPGWATSLLDRFGLTDIFAVREKIVAGLTNSFRMLAGQAFTIGQSAFGFIMTIGLMLYLAFFLLRDGEELSALLGRAVPIAPGPRHELAVKFVAVIRATIKGTVVVAILQGALGGLIFWALGIQGALLWGVLMAFLSLLPAIGTGLVWVPVAFYLLVTGAIWQGAVLVFCGIFVIGMVDNVLRPILVGRDLRMPDYVVLISTLGGIEVFGINGFVVGPVIAALFMAVWDIMTEMRGKSSAEGAPFSEATGED